MSSSFSVNRDIRNDQSTERLISDFDSKVHSYLTSLSKPYEISKYLRGWFEVFRHLGGEYDCFDLMWIFKNGVFHGNFDPDLLTGSVTLRDDFFVLSQTTGFGTAHGLFGTAPGLYSTNESFLFTVIHQ